MARANVIAALLALALTAGCGPDETAVLDELVVIEYSIDGAARTAKAELVADGEASVFVIVKLPPGVLPKPVKLSTTLGSFRRGGEPAREEKRMTDPGTAEARFKLYGGDRAGFADLTATVSAKVDGEDLSFSVFGQVPIKAACPTGFVLRPDASNARLRFDKSPFLVVAQVSRPGAAKPSDVRIDLAPPRTVEGEAAGVLFSEGRPFTDDDGKLRASLYPSEEGAIIIEAIAVCQHLPGETGGESERLSASLKVVYEKPKEQEKP